jgi:tripartite-type tricarboxylate transporter receptor subunit TctC
MKNIIAALMMAIPAMSFAWQPTKPITVIVPVAPGSGQEMAFRAVTAQMEKSGLAKFVYDYRAGGDGNPAMNHFASQPADGYTIAIPACQSTFVASDVLYKDIIKFDPMEFSLITNIGKSPLAFVANITSPINTVPELIEAVRSGKRNIDFSTGGAAHQLAFEYFMDQIGGNRETSKNVPHKGPVPALTSALQGSTEFAIVPTAVANTLIDSGKIKIIGIAGEKPLKAFAKVPLMQDFVKGLNVYACWNVILPKGAPAEVVKWYTDTFIKSLNTKEFETWADANMVIIDEKSQGPAGLRRDMLALRKQWQPYVAKTAGKQ